MQITTKDGFTCNINEEFKDDYEFFENLCAVQNGDASKLPQVLNMMLGADKKRFLDHYREDGRVKMSKIVEVLPELFALCGNDGKK